MAGSGGLARVDVSMQLDEENMFVLKYPMTTLYIN